MFSLPTSCVLFQCAHLSPSCVVGAQVWKNRYEPLVEEAIKESCFEAYPEIKSVYEIDDEAAAKLCNERT